VATTACQRPANDGKIKDAVDKDWRRCAAFGVNAVPTFLAGKYLIVGAQPYEELKRLIEHVLKEQ